MNERLKYPLVLTLICLIAAAALAYTFSLTRDRIAASRRSELIKGLEAVMPPTKDKIEERILPSVTAAQPSDREKLYVALDANGNVVAYAAIGFARGYSSEINVMVGVTPDFAINAIRILSQSETPGLGERTREVPPTKSIWKAVGDMFAKEQEPFQEVILDPPFQAQFRNKTWDQLVVTTTPGADGITVITGATITTQAVVDAVRNAVRTIENAVSIKQPAGL